MIERSAGRLPCAPTRVDEILLMTKNKTKSESSPTAFEQIENRLKAEGYADDDLEKDRFAVEMRNCPGCGRKLKYKGLSSPVEYLGFGYCGCGYVKEFFAERCEIKSGVGSRAKSG